MASPGAQVEGAAGASIAQVFERADVRFTQVEDMDVIPDRGSVGGWVVGPIDIELRPRAQGCSKDIRDEVRFGIVVLADDAGLVTIRSREASTPPLEPVSDSTRRWVKYSNLALPPLLVIGYGIARWRMRKTRKRALEIQ